MPWKWRRSSTKWDEIIKAELAGFSGSADARAKKEAQLRTKQKAEVERVKIGQAITEIRESESVQLSGVDTKDVQNELRAAKQNALGIVNIEFEKEKKRLEIRIESGKKLLIYLKAQGAAENAALISSTQAGVEALEKQLSGLTKLDTSSGAGFFGSLLGLGGDDLAAFKVFSDTVANSISTIAALQLQASEARLQQIEAEITAKQE